MYLISLADAVVIPSPVTLLNKYVYIVIFRVPI